MNIQRFILPVTIAAAFHASMLLYGKPQVHLPPAVAGKPQSDPGLPPEDRLAEIPLANDPTDDPPTMPAALAQGVELPSLEEVLTDKPSDFHVDVERSNPTKTTVLVTTIGPIGSPVGIPNGKQIKGSIFSPVQLDKIPQATVRGSPTYPSSLKNSGIEGVVMVEFDVDTKGRVISARVHESTHRAFEDPTLRAVLNWRFEPGRKDGRAVPFRMMIPVNFKLGDS